MSHVRVVQCLCVREQEFDSSLALFESKRLTHVQKAICPIIFKIHVEPTSFPNAGRSYRSRHQVATQYLKNQPRNRLVHCIR